MADSVVSLQNLRKTYPNGVEAVKGITLEVFENEILGFLGPNGAGKTTTIKMLVGLLKPTSGKINVFGKELFSHYNELKTKIGYSPQDLVFYGHLTVQENAELFASLYEVPNAKSRIDELFSLFQLDSVRKRKASNLSGGQKRRLNTVISLLNAPELLILDEPSAGMDPQSRKVLWDNIKKLVKEENITIILTTHLMEVADRLSHRICIIDQGKVLKIGPPEELKRETLSTEILELQLSPDAPQSVKQEMVKTLGEIGYSPELFDASIRISIKKGSEDLINVVDLLKNSGYTAFLQNIIYRENTLEDVFIELTGKKLRE